MSPNWKLWFVSSSVVCALACSSNNGGDGDLDGGDSTDESDDVDASIVDGGGMDARRPDGSTRRDATTPSGDDGGEDPGCGVLMAKIRDFTPQTNADFETFSGSGATVGILENMLDSNHLPVFKAPQGQVTSKTTFDQWYRDVPNTNMVVTYAIPNQSSVPNEYSFSSNAFFPVDGKGFGNYGSSGHNFHFTTQIAANFTYEGGEVFEFRGDDDLWIFVNGRLALDLGGLHSAVMGEIRFDSRASELGITKGGTYRMDIFHAERHTEESNFQFRTTIRCFVTPPIFL
jgi:fibro-slime domain-containing protein